MNTTETIQENPFAKRLRVTMNLQQKIDFEEIEIIKIITSTVHNQYNVAALAQPLYSANT